MSWSWICFLGFSSRSVLMAPDSEIFHSSSVQSKTEPWIQGSKLEKAHPCFPSWLITLPPPPPKPGPCSIPRPPPLPLPSPSPCPISWNRSSRAGERILLICYSCFHHILSSSQSEKGGNRYAEGQKKPPTIPFTHLNYRYFSGMCSVSAIHPFPTIPCTDY